MTTPLHNTPACPGHGSPATHHPCLEARLTQLRAENEELRQTREHLRDFIRVLIEQRDQKPPCEHEWALRVFCYPEQNGDLRPRQHYCKKCGEVRNG